MLVRFDYRCDNCERTTDRLVKKERQDDQHCAICCTPMRRLPAAPRTTFRFADTKLKP